MSSKPITVLVVGAPGSTTCPTIDPLDRGDSIKICDPGEGGWGKPFTGEINIVNDKIITDIVVGAPGSTTCPMFSPLNRGDLVRLCEILDIEIGDLPIEKILELIVLSGIPVTLNGRRIGFEQR